MKRGNRDDVIQINVGGTIFTTLACTICLHDSILKQCLENNTHHKLACDANGITFLDQDPVIFIHILNWMRSGKMFLCPTDPQFDQVGYMADYLGLDALLKEMQWRELKQDGVVVTCIVSLKRWKVVCFDKIQIKYKVASVRTHSLAFTCEMSFFVQEKDKPSYELKVPKKEGEQITDDFIEKKLKEVVFFYASTLFSSSVKDLTLVKLLMSMSRSISPDSLVNQL